MKIIVYSIVLAYLLPLSGVSAPPLGAGGPQLQIESRVIPKEIVPFPKGVVVAVIIEGKLSPVDSLSVYYRDVKDKSPMILSYSTVNIAKAVRLEYPDGVTAPDAKVLLPKILPLYMSGAWSECISKAEQLELVKKATGFAAEMPRLMIEGNEWSYMFYAVLHGGEVQQYRFLGVLSPFSISQATIATVSVQK